MNKVVVIVVGHFCYVFVDYMLVLLSIYILLYLGLGV